MPDQQPLRMSQIRSAYRDAANVAIRIVRDSYVLPDPEIVCTRCDAVLTTLADMDTVASLMTLAAEHTCVPPSPAPAFIGG